MRFLVKIGKLSCSSIERCSESEAGSWRLQEVELLRERAVGDGRLEGFADQVAKFVGVLARGGHANLFVKIYIIFKRYQNDQELIIK